MAEYWINNTVAKYYHKYIVEENGKHSETDWQLVDEDLFYDNLDNIGMAIYSKPLGKYNKEAVEEAAPPGMNAVGNPKYGTWKKDSEGNKFWEFYGKWMFFSHIMGGFGYNRPYYYNSWYDYDRNYRGSRSYYGSNGSRNYGTRSNSLRNSSSYKSSNYGRRIASSNSSFSSKNIGNTIKKNSSSSSLRSGSSRRGGGPSKGGK
jgi:hypothetical protein